MSFYKIRPRSGTKAQWETANTILGEREIGYELPDGGVGTGAVKMKMGDGVTAWNDLPYAIPIGLTPDDIVQDATTDSSVKVPSAKVAKDIQDQVDVLNSNLSNLNSNLTYSDVSYQGEVVGNDDHAFIIIIPNGYKPLSCCMINDVNNNANSFGILSSPIKNDNYAKCRWKNITISNVIINVTVRFYFIKE